MYYAWLNKKGYEEKTAFPNKRCGERKEKNCIVRGVEMKEVAGEFHLEGLIATSHIDLLDQEEGIEIPDTIPRETLESFAAQINGEERARIMGLHHSEGRTGEYFGVADVEKNPAKVIQLSDGEWGLWVDTKLLPGEKHDEIVDGYRTGDLWGFSITYDTNGFATTDFDWKDDKLVRVLNPETTLFGYTAASNPVNPQALATSYGFKEFKEMVKPLAQEAITVIAHEEQPVESTVGDVQAATQEEKPMTEAAEVNETVAAPVGAPSFDMKEFADKVAAQIISEVNSKMEVKEKVLIQTEEQAVEFPVELKEFHEVLDKKELEVKEQFVRASALADKYELWERGTGRVENREFKSFATNGRKLEYKSLGVTTNRNTDTDYLQSTAELQDVYDPIIYSALNQVTVTWNLLQKDSFAGKGNNQVQFTLKTAANSTAMAYTGNAVTTGNVTRLKFQTKFKKYAVGVSIDGDMIAAARGGPVSDVFAQEVQDSTMDLLSVMNTALFAEVGLETAAGVIGFEFISDSAGNTTMYSLTRSTTNRLSPDAAGDTYINQSSAVISMTNLRAAIRQAVLNGANKANLVFITAPVQGDMLRNKMDDMRRALTSKETAFGFSTDLSVDGVPVFEDKDCNTDDWWLIDLETHRIAIWVPPTIEMLGKTADSQDAFIKCYWATYNRNPRRLVQIYGCATS